MVAKEPGAVRKRYELVPPDGRYGYIVLVAATVIFISTGMFAVCFGMIFNDFFKKLGMGSTDISLLTGINAMCVAISGFLTGPLLKVMSMRKLAFVGSAFYNAGIFGTVFVNTQAQFILCQGTCLYLGYCTMTNKEPTRTRSYRLEPPDGGYGYIVLAAATLIFTAMGMFFVCFTMIFNDLFKTLGMGSTDMSLVTGIGSLGLAVSGCISGPLLKLMSRRKLAFVGCIFLNAGYFGTVFVSTKAQFIVCQGLLKSVGTGFLYNVTLATLNDYFLKKRLFSISFVLSAETIGTMFAPMLATWCTDHYGFHNTLLVISAVTMQTFVGSALLQPVAWHMKKVEIADDIPENTLLLEDTPFDADATKNEDVQIPLAEDGGKENANYMSCEENNCVKTLAMHGVISKVKSIVDWPLLKRFGLTCGCLGPPISIFTNHTSISFLAPALYASDWNTDQVKLAYSLFSFGDISARILMILTSLWLTKISSHLIYIIGLLIAITTKTAMLCVRDYTSTLAIIAVMGVSHCTIMMMFPVVVSDSVAPEEYPSAIGICMLMFGFLSITIEPIIGTIRDATNNYTQVFLIVIGITVGITFIWTVELIRSWVRKTPNSVQRKTKNRELSITSTSPY